MHVLLKIVEMKVTRNIKMNMNCVRRQKIVIEIVQNTCVEEYKVCQNAGE